MLKLSQLSRGFTIVELLVVIVVIAILASITIVSYNGIQGQARNAMALASVDAYQKGFQIAQTIDGQYPYDGAAVNVCIGDIKNYPATANFEEGQCYISKTPGYADGIIAKHSEVTSARIKTALGALPATSTQELSFKLGTSTYWIRGLIFAKATSGYKDRLIFMQKEQDLPCGRGEKIIDSSGLASCSVILQ